MESGLRRYENGHWWQWDGSAWALEPGPLTSGQLLPPETRSVDERVVDSQRAAEARRRGDKGPHAGRVVGWWCVIATPAILMAGAVTESRASLDRMYSDTDAVMHGGLANPTPVGYPIGFAVAAVVALLVGVLLIIGNRRQ
jgi:hypothetical protein